MAFDVFISYSSRDKIAADAACATLEAAGVRCWIAPRDIRPGGEYGAAIIDAIDQCRVMVLIFSASANESHQIHREIERAVSKSVPIVPVRIEEVVPTKSLEYFLGAIHWLDALSPPLENHLQQLADTVKALLQVSPRGRSALADDAMRETSALTATRAASGERTVATAKADQRAERRMASPRWLMPALAGVLVVALITGGLWLYQRSIVPVELSTVKPAPVPTRQAEVLVPETVPFISDSEQATLRRVYLPAPDHKAVAISSVRSTFVTGQKDGDTAATAALEACKRESGSVSGASCQVYAVGNTVVFKGGLPPVAPQPWVIRDPLIERSVVTQDVPLVRDIDRAWLAKEYVAQRKPKAVATALPRLVYYASQSNTDDAVRRAMEWCSFLRGAPCMILAVDDVLVVPNPKTMKAVDIFQAATHTAIAAEDRAAVARRLANATSGWKAVAVGSNGYPGLGLRAAKEQDAVDAALQECRSRDNNCRVIAIGPFLVEPLPPVLASAPPPPPPPPPRPVGETFRDQLANGQPCPTCPEMVVVPPGKFTMGAPSNEPGRRAWEAEVPIAIARPFAVGKFSVTRAEFEAFVKATDHQVGDSCYTLTNNAWRSTQGTTFREPGFAQDDKHPVVCMNWNDARTYVAWLSTTTGKDYRLLSEAEREYVARAGKTTTFWWGTSVASSQANYNGRVTSPDGATSGEFRGRTVPVDTFEPNPWGLYNVHGNVWDWVEDCRTESNTGYPADGSARTSGSCIDRKLRGGSWVDGPQGIRAAVHGWGRPGNRFNHFGFRVARAL